MLVTSRSARTLRSMAELVSAAVERRARVHASGWAAGVGGRAPYSSGGWPALSVARQATRSAASGYLAELMSNTASALATVRPYVMRGAPRGRGCGTQQESMRRGSREKGMRATWPSQPSCRRAT